MTIVKLFVTVSLRFFLFTFSHSGKRLGILTIYSDVTFFFLVYLTCPFQNCLLFSLPFHLGLFLLFQPVSVLLFLVMFEMPCNKTNYINKY